MPELPEVENVRRSVARVIIGRPITAIELRRPDIVRDGLGHLEQLDNTAVSQVDRHGKQLAIVTDAGPTLLVHLGMTGQLRAGSADDLRHAEQSSRTKLGDHIHLVIHLDDGLKLWFRDPRRFGGIWVYPDLPTLRQSRWDILGQDALAIQPRQLFRNFRGTRRALKAALLDQAVVAGLGNIYVDELLFRMGLPPSLPAGDLDPGSVKPLVSKMRRLLLSAIRSGGSTLRDYADGDGQQGGFQLKHRVYGRAGLPCRRCKRLLIAAPIAGRTTVWCEKCQPEIKPAG